MHILEAWNDLPGSFSHLDITPKRIENLRNIFEIYAESFADFENENKIVVDYGCGGGWYSKFIKCRYIGLDISNKSLDYALLNNPNKHFYKILYNEYIDNHRGDILLSLACIQHFPTVKYLNGFLESINNNYFETVILQYRYDKKTRCQDEPYKTPKHIIYACFTNTEYIIKKLSNYIYIGEMQNMEKNNTRYIYFERSK